MFCRLPSHHVRRLNTAKASRTPKCAAAPGDGGGRANVADDVREPRAQHPTLVDGFLATHAFIYQQTRQLDNILASINIVAELFSSEKFIILLTILIFFDIVYCISFCRRQSYYTIIILLSFLIR